MFGRGVWLGLEVPEPRGRCCQTRGRGSGRARRTGIPPGGGRDLLSNLALDYGQDTGLGPNDGGSSPLRTSWALKHLTEHEAADEPLPNSVSHTDRSLIPTEPLQS